MGGGSGQIRPRPGGLPMICRATSRPLPFIVAILLAAYCTLAPHWLPAAVTTLPLQTRDEENRPQVKEAKIEAARIGVVVMDMWDKHWDPLATRRVTAMVPRMNQFLHNSRAAGAHVIFSPSNTINATYAATRQRQAVLLLP